MDFLCALLDEFCLWLVIARPKLTAGLAERCPSSAGALRVLCEAPTELCLTSEFNLNALLSGLLELSSTASFALTVGHTFWTEFCTS